jgi:hypothetical protein
MEKPDHAFAKHKMPAIYLFPRIQILFHFLPQIIATIEPDDKSDN